MSAAPAVAVQIELWQLVTLLLSFFAVCFGFGKLLLALLSKRLDAMEAAAKAEAAEWRRVENDLMRLQADMPLYYVRRDDYIRGQSVIEAKLDGLASRIENAQLRAIIGAQKNEP